MPRVCLALCLAFLLPAAAAAQPIDQQSAQALRQDLQSWFAGLAGPGHGPAAANLQVTPEVDHFHVVLPFANATPGTAISADLRPLGSSRWAVDALRLPADSHFTVLVPQPGEPPQPTMPTRFFVRIGRQDNHATVDPTLATPSSLNIDLTNVAVTSHSATEDHEQRIGRDLWQATLRPRAGRMDLLQQTTILNWNDASRRNGGPAFGFGVDRAQGSSEIDGIDRARAGALLTAIEGFIATLPPAGAAPNGHPTLSPPARAALRALIVSLRGVVTRMQGQETLDGVHIAIAGKGEATVRQVRLGMTGGAPNGMLHATWNVALDGLTVSSIAPQAAALVPHHVALQPSVSGVPLAGLTTLALAATNPAVSHAQLQADATALLAQGGVTVGLDALDLDVGPAVLHGHGHVRLLGPGNYVAYAHITATGLDDLMRLAATNPNLQRALPLLAMARGFARQQGDHLVWDIDASHGGVTVNGVALGKPPAAGP